MTAPAPAVRYVDLDFQGIPHVIATAVLESPHGAALVDPGPGSCLPVLEARLAELGVRFADVSTLLLTHVHLDHAAGQDQRETGRADRRASHVTPQRRDIYRQIATV